MKRLPIAVAALTLLVAAPSYAGFLSGGVQIDGGVTQRGTAQEVTNTARNGGKAVLGVAVIRNASDIEIDGNVNQTGTVRDATNSASGRGAVACLEVAAIGSEC